MISRNKVKLLNGVFDFLNRNADLVNNELRVSHFVKPATALQYYPDYGVRLQLIKKSALFKTEVWSMTWHEGFNEYIELPDNLCNLFIQARLAVKRKKQETENAKQNCQATLFHADSSA